MGKQTMLPKIPKDQYVNVNGINTRYWTLGDKDETIILVLGGGSSVEVWCYNISALAQHYRVYAIDYTGFGLSDKPFGVTEEPDVTPSYWANFINSFMETMSIERATCVGVSMGGVICLELERQFPDKVDSLVLVESVGLGIEIFPFIKKIRSVPFIGSIIISLGVKLFLAFPYPQPKALLKKKGVYRFFKGMVYDSDVISDEFLDLIHPVWREFITSGGEKTFKVMSNWISPKGRFSEKVFGPIIKNLPAITVPTLIIWGKQGLSPLSWAYAAEKAIPNAELHVFDQCGHVPQIEHPEEFNALVLDFLKNKVY